MSRALFTPPMGDQPSLSDALRLLVAPRIRLLLLAGGIHPAEVVCRVDHVATSLRVVLELPVPVPISIQQALTVRVLDAVGALGQTVGRVTVSVEASVPPSRDLWPLRPHPPSSYGQPRPNPQRGEVP